MRIKYNKIIIFISLGGVAIIPFYQSIELSKIEKLKEPYIASDSYDDTSFNKTKDLIMTSVQSSARIDIIQPTIHKFY